MRPLLATVLLLTACGEPQAECEVENVEQLVARYGHSEGACFEGVPGEFVAVWPAGTCAPRQLCVWMSADDGRVLRHDPNCSPRVIPHGEAGSNDVCQKF